MDEAGPSDPKKQKRSYNVKRPLSDAELLELLENSDDDLENLESWDKTNPQEEGGDRTDDSDPEYFDSADEEECIEVLHENVDEFLDNNNENDDGSNAWSSDKPILQKMSFTGHHGLKVVVASNDPIDFFYLLANDEFFDMIIKGSNDYAVQVLAESKGDQSRISRWKDITNDDFKTFLGLLFHMGTIKLNRINDYWKKHFLFNLPVFSNFMSRNRFLLIMRTMHFTKINGDIRDTSRLAKISPLCSFFNARMQAIYYPQKNLAIDESMVLWRGRLVFRQYIKNKRHKYGIKLYILAEPNGIALKTFIYAGAADLELGGTNHTKKVVEKLLQDKEGVGHSVYLDNYYNSVTLSEKLLDKKIYSTGTLRSSRSGNPKQVLQKKLQRGESYAEYTKRGICVTKWKDRREVLSISSEFSGEMKDALTKRGAEVKKPEMILEYNKNMGGIDQHDQMMAYYPCHRKTLRWYKKLGVHIFQMMLINSFHLYNKYSGKKSNFYDYRLAIIEKLLGQPPEKFDAAVPIYHLPEHCPKDSKGKTMRRRCKYCWETEKRRKDTIYFCPQCPDKPGFCLQPCFRSFHEK